MSASSSAKLFAEVQAEREANGGRWLADRCSCCMNKVSDRARGKYYAGVIGVYQCPHCGAVLGSCYKGDSYGIVLPYFTDDPEATARQRYFDLEVVGSAGVERRHGWFDPQTKRITQVG